MNTPLKQALRQHLAQQRLPDERMRALLALAESAPSRRRRSRLRLIAAGTATFLVALAIGLMFAQHGPSGPFERDAVRRIADEVAANHLQLKPLETTSGRIDTVDRFFENLGIRLTEPPLALARGWRLNGARYCSIQGITAAQLRYQDEDRRIHTLYQAPYRPDRHGQLPDTDLGQHPIAIIARGVEVTIWVQGGTLFASAVANTPAEPVRPARSSDAREHPRS